MAAQLSLADTHSTKETKKVKKREEGENRGSKCVCVDGVRWVIVVVCGVQSPASRVVWLVGGDSIGRSQWPFTSPTTGNTACTFEFEHNEHRNTHVYTTI